MRLRTIFRFIAALLGLSALWMVGLEEQAYADVSGDYEYTSNMDGTATITRYLGTDLAVSIPAALAGLNVVEIGPGAFFKLPTDPDYIEITEVTIPNTVT